MTSPVPSAQPPVSETTDAGRVGGEDWAGFEREASRLYATVAARFLARREDWEAIHGPADDELAAFLFETAVVCVDHRRFVPCRTCLAGEPAARPYSDLAADVAAVRAHHTDSRPDR